MNLSVCVVNGVGMVVWGVLRIPYVDGWVEGGGVPLFGGGGWGAEGRLD